MTAACGSRPRASAAARANSTLDVPLVVEPDGRRRRPALATHGTAEREGRGAVRARHPIPEKRVSRGIFQGCSQAPVGNEFSSSSNQLALGQHTSGRKRARLFHDPVAPAPDCRSRAGNGADEDKRDDLDRQDVRDRRKRQTATAVAHADDAVVPPCSGGARPRRALDATGERCLCDNPAARRQQPRAHAAQAYLPPATRLWARRVGCRAARRPDRAPAAPLGEYARGRRQPGRVIGDRLPRKRPKRPRTGAPGARLRSARLATPSSVTTGGGAQFAGADRGRMVEWACRPLLASSSPSATPRRSSWHCGSASCCSRPSRISASACTRAGTASAFAIPTPATSVPSTRALPTCVCCSGTAYAWTTPMAARGRGHPDPPRHRARSPGPTRRDARTPRSRCRGRAPLPSLSDETPALAGASVSAPGRIRTCDPRLRRPPLCPAELPGP
jgi:hypothetical protein